MSCDNSVSISAMTDVWNTGANYEVGIQMDVSDVSSAANSELLSLLLNSAHKFSVDKSGTVIVTTTGTWIRDTSQDGFGKNGSNFAFYVSNSPILNINSTSIFPNTDFVYDLGSSSGIFNNIYQTTQSPTAPTTTEYPNSGAWGVHSDTSGNQLYIAYNNGGVIETISFGSQAIGAFDEGSLLTSSATGFNFTGPGVVATLNGGVVDVTIASGGGGGSGNPLSILDEGIELHSDVVSIDFSGGGVTATNIGNAVTVTIPSATSFTGVITDSSITGDGLNTELGLAPLATGSFLTSVSTGPTITGDGAGNALNIPPSTDANNLLTIGTDNRLFVDSGVIPDVSNFITGVNVDGITIIGDGVGSPLVADTGNYPFVTTDTTTVNVDGTTITGDGDASPLVAIQQTADGVTITGDGVGSPFAADTGNYPFVTTDTKTVNVDGVTITGDGDINPLVATANSFTGTTTDDTIDGNGLGAPLSINISTDVANAIVTGTDGGIYAEISGTLSGSPIIVKDEGSILTSSLTEFNFVGSGVEATNVGDVVTVTISGLEALNTDNTIDGDGLIIPLSVPPSDDANNLLILGGDGQLFVDSGVIPDTSNFITGVLVDNTTITGDGVNSALVAISTSDTNIANTNLTFDADRTHALDGNNLVISSTGESSIELYTSTSDFGLDLTTTNIRLGGSTQFAGGSGAWLADAWTEDAWTEDAWAEGVGSGAQVLIPGIILTTADNTITSNCEYFSIQGNDVSLLPYLRLYNGGSTTYTEFSNGSIVNVSYTLPTGDGSNGQQLTTDGNGNLYWSSSGGGGNNFTGVVVDNVTITGDGDTSALVAIQQTADGVTITGDGVGSPFAADTGNYPFVTTDTTTVNVDGTTITGDGDASPLVAIQQTADGVTITGDGVGSPFAADTGNYPFITSITVDGVTITGDGNANPIVALAQTTNVDGVTITGNGTTNPLVATANSFTGVTTDNSIDGDGDSTPLSVNISTDLNNIIITGTDGGIFAEISGDAVTLHYYYGHTQSGFVPTGIDNFFVDANYIEDDPFSVSDNTGTLTIQQDGRYHIGVDGSIANQANEEIIELYQNGTGVARTVLQDLGGDDIAAFGLTFEGDFFTNDTIQLVKNSSGLYNDVMFSVHQLVTDAVFYGSITGNPLTIEDEGSTLTTNTTSIDFVGSFIAATNAGDAVTVTVSDPQVDGTTITGDGLSSPFAADTGSYPFVTTDTKTVNVDGVTITGDGDVSPLVAIQQTADGVTITGDGVGSPFAADTGSYPFTTDTNFANTSFTFNSSRFHELDGNSFGLSSSGDASLILFKPTGDLGLRMDNINATLGDTSTTLSHLIVHYGSSYVGSRSSQFRVFPLFGGNAGVLRIMDTTQVSGIALTVPTNVANNVTYVLPDTDGSNGQQLTTDGGGNLSWQNADSGSSFTGVSVDNVTITGNGDANPLVAIQQTADGVTITGDGVGSPFAADTGSYPFITTDTHFFNTDLSLNTDRAHDLNGNTLSFDNGGTEIARLDIDQFKILTNSGLVITHEPSSNSITLRVPSLSTSTVYILPTGDGASGTILSTDGVGNLSWVPDDTGVGGGGGSGFTGVITDLTLTGNGDSTSLGVSFSADSDNIVTTGTDGAVYASGFDPLDTHTFGIQQYQWTAMPSEAIIDLTGTSPAQTTTLSANNTISFTGSAPVGFDRVYYAEIDSSGYNLAVSITHDPGSNYAQPSYNTFVLAFKILSDGTPRFAGVI